MQFAAGGADVVICDVCAPMGTSYPSSTEGQLEETRELVEQLGRRCVAAVADVRDAASLDALVARAAAELGPVDILVANAGVLDNAPLHELDAARWQKTIDTNLTGVFNSIKAVLPSMLELGRGRIIAISSMAGRRGYGNCGAYAASKWGVIGLAKDAAIELGPSGITVNVVCPTTVNTDMGINERAFKLFCPDVENPGIDDLTPVLSAMHPQRVPWIEPSDVSAAVLFLASDEARYITGEVITVSAGMTAQNSS